MVFWRIIFVTLAASLFVEAKWKQHQKREVMSDICDPVYNNTNKVQCYCINDNDVPSLVRSADCYLINQDIKSDDKTWNSFKTLKNVNKLTLTNTKGISFKYVPTKAIQQTNALLKLDIKYGNIETIEAYAFANLSFVEEMTIRDNQIKKLGAYAFAHHRDLKTISLDTNNIVEINRDVFIDLPSLEKLFLTSNKITTIHDKAFIHLTNLKELEIDRNGLFSLNSETFSGLKNLLRLDMSSNSLEVIGDNTFLPLVNLQSLNLEGNKIQMLDEKAFNGLSKLQSLSLAHNKLVDIDNVKVFEGLESLISLGLSGNQIRELKTEVMAPILNNFYGNTSSLDVEDNNFPCDCRLDWFISLMNKTQNQHLKLTIENLKCNPDANLKEKWSKIQETDKNGGQVFENEESLLQSTDYEYYDDTQLNGKLFYIDVRDLINCTNPTRRTSFKELADVPKSGINKATVKTTTTTKVTSSPIHTTPKTLLTTEYIKKIVNNQGLLDLSVEETTTKAFEATKMLNDKSNKIEVNEEKSFVTTTRLATVSAKPIERRNMYADHDMASDEAKPDNIKAHRIVQHEVNDSPKFNVNSACNNGGCAYIIISIILCFRLVFY